jgi:alcohol dehydrogenase class IV
VLAQTVAGIVRDTGGPQGLAAFGYGEADIPALIDGALKQERLLACCPRQVGAPELEQVLRASIQW